MLTDDRAQRLQRVQAALEHAETATGLRPVAWSTHSGRGGPSALLRARPEADRADGTDRAGKADGTDRAGAAGRAAGTVEESGPQASTLSADASWLPVPAGIAGLLPHGAVRRGTSLVVERSTALLLHLTAALMTDGAWCALVSQPDLGLAAALDSGVDPARCVMVPDPGQEAAAVLGAVTDGFDVVVVGPCSALGERDRRAISQRIRHRGAVLLSTRPWPGSEVTLTVTGRTGEGLDTHGRLVAEELVVASSGRGLGAGRTRRVRIARQDGVTHLVARTTGPTPATLPSIASTTVTSVASPSAQDLIARRAG